MYLNYNEIKYVIKFNFENSFNNTPLLAMNFNA